MNADDAVCARAFRHLEGPIRALARSAKVAFALEMEPPPQIADFCPEHEEDDDLPRHAWEHVFEEIMALKKKYFDILDGKAVQP
jgi:hypothetical protein